jgi:hypothetical protein
MVVPQEQREVMGLTQLLTQSSHTVVAAEVHYPITQLELHQPQELGTEVQVAAR